MKSRQIDRSPKTFILLFETGDQLAKGLLAVWRRRSSSARRSAPAGLANYVFGRGMGFNQVKDCPKRLCEFVPLCRFYVPEGDVCIVQNEDAGRFAIPPKMLGNCYVAFRRIPVRKLPQAQRSLMVVDALSFVASASGTPCA